MIETAYRTIQYSIVYRYDNDNDDTRATSISFFLSFFTLSTSFSCQLFNREVLSISREYNKGIDTLNCSVGRDWYGTGRAYIYTYVCIERFPVPRSESDSKLR